MRTDLVIRDQRRDREEAQALRCIVFGTIGVLERVIRNGLVDDPEVTTKLTAISFRATPKLLAYLAGLTRERLSG